MYTPLTVGKLYICLKLTSIFICLFLMLTIMNKCVELIRKKIYKKLFKKQQKMKKEKKTYICIVIIRRNISYV